MRFPRNASTPFVAQRTPRVSGRGDRPTLALHDAGHGQDPVERNPILYALGVTLNIQLDPFVRTWQAFVRAYSQSESAIVTEEITEYFVRDKSIPRRYSLNGPVGVFPLGNSDANASYYETTQRIEIVVQTRNADLTNEQTYEFYVRAGNDLRHCPAAEGCDFALFSPISKAGVRIFENFITRTASENAPVSFFFGTLDLLLAAVPSLMSIIPNYSASATVGVEFGNSGECGPRSAGSTPSCASLRCCCEIQTDAVTITLRDITTSSDILPNATVTLNDVIEVLATIVTRGSVNCIGFLSLVVTLPGKDTNDGYWELDCPPSAGTFAPVVKRNGSTIAPVFKQDNVVNGTGSGNHATLDFAGIAIACGDTITVKFRVKAARATATNSIPQSIGPLGFSDGGPCNPNKHIDLPGLEIGSLE